jgi:predicted transcriptional regulator of viral defense system
MVSRSLSPTEARIILGLEADGRETVELAEIRRRARVSPGFARKLAHDLAQKGWLQRIRRGLYLVHPGRRGPESATDLDPLKIGARLATPYYFGYATAAELLGLLPQLGHVYYLVSPVRTQPPKRTPIQFRFVRTEPGRMFGTVTLHRRGELIRVSNVERTLLDCLRRPELAGGVPGVTQMVASGKSRLRWDLIPDYARRLGAHSLTWRLGYLAEQVRPDISVPRQWTSRVRPKPEDPYVPLAPAREFGRRGPHDRRWHVIVNLPRAHLLGEVEVR